MTDQPTPRPMTANQLRAIVNKIARTYLEVERGLRSHDQLAQFLTSAEFRRHAVSRQLVTTPGRAVRPTDIGDVRLDASAPDLVHASVRVRRDDDRWSALVVDLRQTGRGWQVEQLNRVERLVTRERHAVTIDKDANERRRALIADDREAVSAVQGELQRRYDSIPDKRTSPARALRPELDRWEDRLADLDEELRVLPVGCGAEREWLSDVVAGLGPTDGHQVAERATPATSDLNDLVTRYRERWGIDPDAPLLGIALDEVQEAERRELVDAIQNVFRDELAISPSQHDRTAQSVEL